MEMSACSDKVVASFYRFVDLPDFRDMREPLKLVAQRLSLTGTILLAPEGINASLCGTRDQIEDALRTIATDPRFRDLDVRWTSAAVAPFHRLRVRLKKEIVTLKRHVDLAAVGTYVNAASWNALLADPDVLVVDTRNSYECEIGNFPGAINPNTANFSEFPAFVTAQLDPAKHRRVAMYCTGGIRCEKASALMRQIGFAEVFHLQGGILGYLQTVSPTENKWVGECFVFDDRGGLLE